MILLYSVIVSLLGMIKVLVNLRARALERKYMRVAGTVDQLVRQSEYKPGNNSKPDACLSAKRTFLLGQLVQQRDRVEANHVAWQTWGVRLTRWVDVVRGWKGKKLPYTLGVLDVSMLLYLIDYLGAGQYLSAENLIQTATELFTQ